MPTPHENSPKYPITLHFTPVSDMEFDDARRAIEQEYRDANSLKKLRCIDVERVAASEDKKREIYSLTIDHEIELEWTWEGARAWCPIEINESDQTDTNSVVWAGNVLNIDEANRQIFVEIAKGESLPRRGTFLIAPFDYLEAIKDAYTEPQHIAIQKLLAERLTATLTGADKTLVADKPPTLTSEKLYDNEASPTMNWWNQAWSIIWGPPGTGKTHTIGQVVAETLKQSPDERILVVSTTNLATDAVAIKVGEAALQRDLPHLNEERILRLGKGVQVSAFKAAGLVSMLNDDTEVLDALERFTDELNRCEDETQKAQIAQKLDEIRRLLDDPVKHHFLHAKTAVVICTAFKATRLVIDGDISTMITQENAPFTTVIIDEAGLLSRMNAAMLSLLAAKRVVLVGDSKQLSPISRISRIIEPALSRWIASSGLVHLDEIPVAERPENVHFLKRQWRMHPHIAGTVSHFMYGGQLVDANAVTERETERPFALYIRTKDLLTSEIENDAEEHPRAVWYVLDEDLKTSDIRHDRGAGNRSYVRDGTIRVLDRLFESGTLAKENGLFVTPFVAQAKKVREYFAQNEYKLWKSSTVHCQQGQEADVVIFDTVNAGSTAWTHHEWMRLINVGISRARRLLILLASRAEMAEPYLHPLCRTLTAVTLTPNQNNWEWQRVATLDDDDIEDAETSATNFQKKPPNSLGRQIDERQLLVPVFSQTQQELCSRKIDGKPRLVRGVAGSGKTVILAEWLVNLLIARRENGGVVSGPFWVVFANKTLARLIKRHVDSAWQRRTGEASPPEGSVVYHHILNLLNQLEQEYGIADTVNDVFDYDGKAATILDSLANGDIVPRCRALFIDEAQDMGPNTLRLLFKLVAPWTGLVADDGEVAPRTAEEKPVYIFYDNAQNVYGRSNPTWSHLGIDVKGRSTVMKESFRTTHEIAEFALNVLYRLKPSVMNDDDHKELVSRELVAATSRNGRVWWSVRFNQNAGPRPRVTQYRSRQEEFTALASELTRLIESEHVSPRDIRIICNKQHHIMPFIDEHVRPRLKRETSRRVDCIYSTDFGAIGDNTILVTSPHSFKGYESEIVFVPAADLFDIGEVLAAQLYVAMTRARSILKMSFTSQTKLRNESGTDLCCVLRESYADSLAASGE
ncbi:MAG: AAA domain-containing protein [Thermoguttaceae bacterium]